MANKSFHTKGLSRQLEEKAVKLQTSLDTLRDDHTKLQEKHDDRVRLANRLQEKVDNLEKETGIREHRLQDQLELAQHERDSIKARHEQATEELHNKKEEKDLLQSRHDALTTESQSLQKDLRKAQATAKELEANLQDQQQQAAAHEETLRNQSKDDMERLIDEIDDLRRESEDKESQFAAQQDLWESLKRGLESQRDKAEEQAAGLQRTIQKLQETEGTLSGREMKLQQALESEKERHQSEEAVLTRQIRELNDEIDTRRQSCEDIRSELSRIKEDLRLKKREEGSLNEKIQGLEDEIVILQGSLDEEADRAKANLSAARHEAEGLRRQLHATKHDLAKAEAAYADARVEIETFQGDLDAGQGSKEQLNSRLRDVEAQLQAVRTEKQQVQSTLADTKVELHSLRTSADEIEVERDELQSQLRQVQEQLDSAYRHDHEKNDLRQTKLRLEGEVARLREERKALIERNEVLERDLEAEVERGGSEEGRLTAEAAALQSKLAAASEGRDRELHAAKQKAQRLELRVEELENHMQIDAVDEDAAAELSIIRKDLSSVRKKETDYLQREAAHREIVRELKHKIADLERQLHDVEIEKLKVDSPRSSAGASARKNELIEVRRQLAEAHQQMKDLRSKMRETEREAQRKITTAEHETRTRSHAIDRDREILQLKIEECRLQQEEQHAKKSSAEQAINRLRTKIHRLEKDLTEARSSSTLLADDRTIADERKDLHEMLKDAKLEVESLHLQISDRDTRIHACATREKDLLTQLKRIRDERSYARARATALTTELETLQSRHERVVEETSRARTAWDDERRNLTHRVRFPNMSVSSVHASCCNSSRVEEERVEREERHGLELRGLGRVIEYLRAKIRREEARRADWVLEKGYYLWRIGVFDAWYV